MTMNFYQHPITKICFINVSYCPLPALFYSIMLHLLLKCNLIQIQIRD